MYGKLRCFPQQVEDGKIQKFFVRVDGYVCLVSEGKWNVITQVIRWEEA